jgi:hypothetical protein
MGRPFDSERQTEVLEAALDLLEDAKACGEIWEI